MSSRSERYRANAEKCQQYADAADSFGTKRLYEELSRQWLRQPTSVNTSAINSRRDIFDSLEREIECFKNSVQPPSQESLAPSGAQD